MNDELSLGEAREIIGRALEKSAEVNWISAYAVADSGGNLISLSRLDGAPAVAVPLARAKAYLAALRGRASYPLELEIETHPLRFHGYQSILPRALFAGPGAVSITRNGRIIGGFSSSTTYSASAMKIVIDGVQYSREEVVTAHALNIPYEDQHPDTP
ncbi:MAG: heme-binding protein [Lautropia sp.]